MIFLLALCAIVWVLVMSWCFNLMIRSYMDVRPSLLIVSLVFLLWAYIMILVGVKIVS